LKTRSLLPTLLLVACGGSSTKPPAATSAPTVSADAADASVDAAPSEPAKPPVSALAKSAAKGVIAAFNAHDVQKMAGYYADGCALREYGPSGLEEHKGRSAIAEGFGPLFSKVPDIAMYPLRFLQKDNVVIVDYVVLGTHAGRPGAKTPKSGAPKKIGKRVADVLTFNEDGLITNDESYSDAATTEKQLGNTPGTARAIPAQPTGDPPWITASDTPDEEALLEQMKATWPAAYSSGNGKMYASVLDEHATHVGLAAGKDAQGKAAIASELASYAASFSKMNVSLDSAWSFGSSTTAAEFTFTGTMAHSKKTVTFHGLDIDVLDDGKLKESVTYSNGLEVKGQLAK
jgi:ketosteroid isomerase-like protein